MIQIRNAEPDGLQSFRELFAEYSTTLGVDLCFQNFQAELAGLPGAYAPPSGALLGAFRENELVGCVALRRLDDAHCEMKRLYVRPAARSNGTGAALASAVIDEARRLGYSRIRLDTLPSMERAIAMYRRIGFAEIPPYNSNPVPGAIFLELPL